MWIVRLALRRPYTVLVAVLAVVLFCGPGADQQLQRDVLPNIDIPVVIVVWNYPGLSADDMETAGRVHHRARALDDGQRHLAHRVAVAARHRPGRASTSRRAPTSARPSRRSTRSATRSCASCRRASRRRPSSSTTPRTCRSRSSRIKSDSLSEQELFDYGLNFLRLRLFTIPGPVDAGAVRRAERGR